MTKIKAKIKTPKSKAQEATNNQELENRLKRALADYQNLEKRIEEERKLLSKLSASLLIEKLLPVLDNLEKAQTYLNDQGLTMVLKQFKDIFAQEGVEEIQAEGAQFNPNVHEAVETREGEKDNIVVKVLTKGYKIEGTVLRAAKVVVERKKVDQEAAAKGPLRSEASEPRSEEREEKAEKAQKFGDYA